MSQAVNHFLLLAWRQRKHNRFCGIEQYNLSRGPTPGAVVNIRCQEIRLSHKTMCRSSSTLPQGVARMPPARRGFDCYIAGMARRPCGRQVRALRLLGHGPRTLSVAHEQAQPRWHICGHLGEQTESGSRPSCRALSDRCRLTPTWCTGCPQEGWCDDDLLRSSAPAVLPAPSTDSLGSQAHYFGGRGGDDSPRHCTGWSCSSPAAGPGSGDSFAGGHRFAAS